VRFNLEAGFADGPVGLGTTSQTGTNPSKSIKYIIQNFTSEYLNGITPNPCIRCNQFLKFGSLFSETALGAVEMPKGERPYRPPASLTRTEMIRLLERKGVTAIKGKPLRDRYTYELLEVVKRWKYRKVR